MDKITIIKEDLINSPLMIEDLLFPPGGTMRAIEREIIIQTDQEEMKDQLEMIDTLNMRIEEADPPPHIITVMQFQFRIELNNYEDMMREGDHLGIKNFNKVDKNVKEHHTVF